jgi:hypothetical protein
LAPKAEKEREDEGGGTYHNVFRPWQRFLVIPFWNGAAVDEHVRPRPKVEAGRVRQYGLLRNLMRGSRTHEREALSIWKETKKPLASVTAQSTVFHHVSLSFTYE